VARVCGCRGIFAEREEGELKLRRGFSIEKGERVLVVEDVVTTGGSTKEVIELVKKCGGIVVGVGSVIDRSDKRVDFGAQFEALAKVKVDTFKEEDCPLCKKKVPVTKPGSRR